MLEAHESRLVQARVRLSVLEMDRSTAVVLRVSSLAPIVEGFDNLLMDPIRMYIRIVGRRQLVQAGWSQSESVVGLCSRPCQAPGIWGCVVRGRIVLIFTLRLFFFLIHFTHA